MNLELQQRAVEYNSIFKKHDDLRNGLFEAMPEFEAKNQLDSTNNEENENIESNEKNDFDGGFNGLNTLEVKILLIF